MKVSVMMLTYNHEKYIAQAIESVLMQNVNLDYELVIGEDCSTDNTRQIVVDFQRRYPDRIRLLLSDTNVGAHLNAERTLQACQGEYIAVLEGDDYWTASDKLQKQVDFLDAHPECALCFHNFRVFYEDGSQKPHDYFQAGHKEISTLEDLLAEGIANTSAVMWRRGLFDELPEWTARVTMADWLVHILNAQHGDIGYINEVMSVYRIHQGGVVGGMNYARKLQAKIDFYQKINPYLNYRYDSIIQKSVSKCWAELADTLVEDGFRLGMATNSDDVARIFADWHPEVSLPARWKSQVLRRIYGKGYPAWLFQSYAARDWVKTRYFWFKTLRYAPAWLRNRGMWSIGIQAFLGSWLADGWRRVTGRASGKRRAPEG